MRARRSGYTLIELMMVMALLSAAFGILVQFFIQTRQNLASVNSTSALLMEAELATRFMAHDLRLARTISVSGRPIEQLQLVLLDGGLITYRRVQDRLERVQRANADSDREGRTTVLTRHVAAFEVKRQQVEGRRLLHACLLLQHRVAEKLGQSRVCATAVPRVDTGRAAGGRQP